LLNKSVNSYQLLCDEIMKFKFNKYTKWRKLEDSPGHARSTHSDNAEVLTKVTNS
jgi:hypothetical protein